MQVKKFEAPTIQEALETIKRELGPEAIILQTKKHKKGFGLLSRSSVEVTAAVSDRSSAKKQLVERKLPESGRRAMSQMGADKQADMLDDVMDRHLNAALQQTSRQDKVDVRTSSRANSTTAASNAAASKLLPDDMATMIARAMSAQANQPSQARGVTGGGKLTSSQEVAKMVTQRRYIDIGEPPKPTAPVQAAPRASNQGSQGSALSEVLGRATQNAIAPELLGELQQLKREVKELKQVADSKVSEVGFTGALQDSYEQLVMGGVDRRLALSLLKKVRFELGEKKIDNREEIADQLAAEILETTEVLNFLGEDKPTECMWVALVGPTGVGKTTTLAKIATEALRKRGLRVGLVNLDAYKVGAFDQLATYARILNVPFRSVSSQQDLASAIADFKGLDLVLVDTAGRSQRDAEGLQELQQLLGGIDQVKTELVLSATTRDQELLETVKRFSMFHPQGLIFSKLDEASLYGAIYNVSQKAKLPLVYFTTGQKVPEDIEEATPERVVSLLMDL